MADLDLLDAMERAYDEAARLIDGVRDDQWSASTPCEDWDVRQLVEHLTGNVLLFSNAVVDEGGVGAPSGDDPASLFRAAASQSLSAWRRPGALDDTLSLPWGDTPASMAININLIDTFQHSWDLARATGQDASLDPAIAEYGLEFTGRMLGHMGRGGMFGEEVPCRDDAPAPDRLAAFLGRRV
jgi:uncharacterized protein (TIGR03086 family)